MKTTSPSSFGPVTANPSEFLVHYRRGKPLKAARGATAFCLPYLDRCVLISGTAHQVEFCADQITAENQGIEVSGFAVWRVKDPLKTCASFDFSNAGEAIAQVNDLLKGVVESATRHEVARMNLNDVLRQRTSIIEALKEEVAPLSDEWGIVLDTVEIRTVNILSQQLFENLQAKFRDRSRLDASVSALETDRAINEQRCREEILRIKAEMETRSATEELDLRKARHALDLATISDETERRRIATRNTRDRALTFVDLLPEIAGSLPLKNIEIRADLLGDLVRTFSALASTPRSNTPTLKETTHD